MNQQMQDTLERAAKELEEEAQKLLAAGIEMQGVASDLRRLVMPPYGNTFSNGSIIGVKIL